MSEKEWDKLFDLIEKAVNPPNATGSWQERRDEMLAAAKARDDDGNLSELVSWFAEDVI